MLNVIINTDHISTYFMTFEGCFEFMINIIKYIFVDLNINFEFWRWNFMLLFDLLLYFNILFKYTYVLLGYTVLVWRSGKGHDISHLFIINSSVILGRGECITYQGWSLSSHHLTYKKCSVFQLLSFSCSRFWKINWKGDNLLVYQLENNVFAKRYMHFFFTFSCNKVYLAWGKLLELNLGMKMFSWDNVQFLGLFDPIECLCQFQEYIRVVLCCQFYLLSILYYLEETTDLPKRTDKFVSCKPDHRETTI